jgi:hypothetical protein
MEGSLVAYKVFTNGSVLQASEINDNLMRQSVMVFSNAAARTAAITAPLEGMLTWLEDVNRYESYNGTAWVSPFGSTLVGSSSFTSVTSVALDNVFTSAYDNYDIYISVSATSASGIGLNLRAAGVNLATATYDQTFIRCENTTITGNNSSSSTNWNPFTVRNATTPNFTKMTLSNPATSGRSKSYVFHTQDRSSLNLVDIGAGRNTTTTVFDGFSFSGSASMTGTVYVYGLRK